jgi:hypothetical protein
MSAANLLEMASLGWVAADDLVLLEGTDVQITVDQFLGMARSGRLPGEAETASVPPSRIPSPTQTGSALPDWLADVRQAESMPKSKVPDALTWLEDIRQIEESLRCRPLGAPTAPAAAPPPQMPAPTGQLQQQGYDPETGQILDAVAYARWQKAEAERRQACQQPQTQVSVAEIFLQAQRTIQEWVDADSNKPLVTAGKLDTIRSCSSVQALMRKYDAYGPVMQDKLWKRLFLLVDNRKKYYQAFR